MTPSAGASSSRRYRRRSSGSTSSGRRRRSARLASIAGEERMERSEEEVEGVMPMEHDGEAAGDVGASSSRRARDRAMALEAAPRFAYFKQEEEVEEGDGEEEEEDDGGEDWPGPFSTAMKLIRELDDRVRARAAKEGGASNAAAPTMDLGWKPSRKSDFPVVAPSLRDLSVKILAANAEHLQSLQGVPGALLKLIALVVCGTRAMGYVFLSVLVAHSPTEIYVPDCSWAEEHRFQQILSSCNTQDLEVLRLDLCGRCLSDDVLSSTLARTPSSLPKLVSVSLVGNYRLSDDGLMVLASSAPMLHSINLSQCSLITSAGIIELLKKLEGVIKELILDDCQNVSGLDILPGLKKSKQLQAISVSRLPEVNDKFVCGLVSACSNLEELGFASCLKLSVKSTKVIGEKCPKLRAIDLRNIVKLTDNAIAYLASGCPSLQKLLLQGIDCSDEAIAAFIEASGNSLIELSLNSLQKVSSLTALAISRRCSLTLQKLDLSFCRLMSDEALGLIVDNCTHLKVLKLFGCTQVTDLFLKGHSNPALQTIGVKGSNLNHMNLSGVIGDW